MLHLGDTADAFIQSDLQPFIHTFARRRSQPGRATASLSGAARVRCPATHACTLTQKGKHGVVPDGGLIKHLESVLANLGQHSMDGLLIFIQAVCNSTPKNINTLLFWNGHYYFFVYICMGFLWAGPWRETERRVAWDHRGQGDLVCYVWWGEQLYARVISVLILYNV